MVSKIIQHYLCGFQDSIPHCLLVGQLPAGLVPETSLFEKSRSDTLEGEGEEKEERMDLPPSSSLPQVDLVRGGAKVKIRRAGQKSVKIN